MQFGDFFFDGDKRKIYEAPTGFSYTLDGSGFRIYTPDIPASAPDALYYSAYELWSRSVDFIAVNQWSTIVFDISGGAYRYTDQYNSDVFALIDLRLINGWQFVPANYAHETYIKGNLFADVDLNKVFDTNRLTVFGVVPSIQFSDAGERSQEDPEIAQQNTEALQYSSFDGGVSVDVLLGPESSGILYPLGTVEHPVNNLADAKIIALDRGFDKFWLFGDLPVTAADDVSGFTIQNRSSNPLKSVVSIDPGSNTNSMQILRAEVSGELDNGIILEGCILSGITFINGYLSQCVLSAMEITLGGNFPAFFLDCKSGIPNNLHTEPSINIGSGQALLLSGYDGDISLRGKTGIDVCSIRMTGLLRIEDTCIAGHIEAYGDAFIIGEDFGPYVEGVGKSALIDRTTGTVEETASAVWNHVI